MNYEDAAIIGVVLLSIAAGVCWLVSSIVTVKAQDLGSAITGHDDGSVRVSFNGIDVIGTAIRQARWNRSAASFACLAAACQALQAWPAAVAIIKRIAH